MGLVYAPICILFFYMFYIFFVFGKKMIFLVGCTLFVGSVALLIEDVSGVWHIPTPTHLVTFSYVIFLNL